MPDEKDLSQESAQQAGEHLGDHAVDPPDDEALGNSAGSGGPPNGGGEPTGGAGGGSDGSGSTGGSDRWQIWGRVVVPVLILAVATAGAWSFAEQRDRTRQEAMLDNERQRAFFDLVMHMEELNLALGKALVPNTPVQHVVTLGEVRRLADLAASDVARLPLSHMTLGQTVRFLAQTSDYSNMLMRKAAAGQKLASADWSQLQRMHGEIDQLNDRLQDMTAQALDGRLRWRELDQVARAATADEPLALRAVKAVEEQTEGFPRVVYDGPFSDEVLQRPFRIEGERITEAQARDIARRFVPLPDDNYEVVLLTRLERPVSGWAFELRPTRGDGPRYRIDVSDAGGKVLWFLSNRRPGQASLSLKDGLQRAEAFVRDRNFPQVEVSNGTRQGGRAIYTFVPVSDGVLLYPDQFRVAVALDNGRVEGYEGLAYSAFHRERALATQTTVSAQQAASRLNPRLKVKASEARLALIPRPDGSEVLTYEFPAQLGENRYLVYLDPKTGVEEQILQVVDTEVGRVVR